MTDNPRQQLFRAMASQQDTLENHDAVIARQNQVINRQASTIRRQGSQIEVLASGLKALCEGLGEGAVKHVTGAMRRTADVQNPAQPIPEPPAQPAAFTTEDAKTPEAMESPQNPGLVPGSTNDVAADATTTVYQPGADIPNSALHNLIDVTTPVDGTQNARPLPETKTLTDVRVSDPNNQSQAFPLRGPFAGQQRTSSHQPQREDSGLRTMAAMRLVEARAATGDEAAENDKFSVIAALERDDTMSVRDMDRERETIEGVTRRTASRAPQRSTVPRPAAGAQHTASMQSSASYGGTPVGGQDIEDSDLFMGDMAE